MEELCAQRLMPDNINMHQINKGGSAAHLLGLLLITITIICPALPQTVTPGFSQAYATLIASARREKWWMTCRNDAPKIPQASLQHLPPTHQNATEQGEQETSSSAESGPVSQMVEEEVSLSEVLWVAADEAWKVGIEVAREVKAHFLRQQESEEVVYADNYASLNGGAIVLRKSSQRIHKADAILQDSTDKYLYSEEQLPIEVVIALKEQVKIQRIGIRSSEVYSSTVKQFELEGALNLQEMQDSSKSTWFRLLSATAKNNGAEQFFRSKNKVARFLRLRIISKHGDWKYFTMTQIKVYGEGLFTEALVNLQTVQSSDPPLRPAQLQLANDLGHAYQQLMSSQRMERPEENVLSFLLEKVGTLSKIHEFQLFYMQNLSMRLENVSRLEREFLQQKNRMDFNNFLEKYPQQGRVEHELAQIKAMSLKLKQDSELFLKLSEMSAPQACPSREEESFPLVTIVIISTAANLLLSVLVAFCCFRHFKHREKQTINKNT